MIHDALFLRDPARRALKALAPFLVLAVLWSVFGIALAIQAHAEDNAARAWDFFGYRTVANVLCQSAGLAIAACGMTMVIVIGGIDLAAGSVIALTCVATALGLAAGWHPLLAATAAIAVGGLCGAISGALTTWGRLTPFIVTLGMLGAARGAAKLLAQDGTVTYDGAAAPLFEELMRPLVPVPDPSFSGALASHPLRVVAPGVWIALAVVVATAAIMRFGVFGRHLYAIGSNPEAARLCGLRVGILSIAVFAIAGALFGLAGVLETARIHVGDPTTAPGRELDIIAAVVIGGASLAGGRGTVVGAVAGVLMMTLLRLWVQRMGWHPAWQEVIIGAVIVAAVALDRWRLSRLAR